jgi:hypothetical protein
MTTTQGTIAVTPDPFHLVEFDASLLRGLVEEIAGSLGLPPGIDITLTVDEAIPHPIVGSFADIVDGAVDLWCTGGCFEARNKTRAFSESHARAEITSMLLRARDRLSGGFEDAPHDGELLPGERAAWDCYTMGRVAALGHRVHHQKRLYDFRLQHGFTDASDAAFDRLWNTPATTWGAIQEICVETGAAQRPKPKLPADLVRRGSRH